MCLIGMDIFTLVSIISLSSVATIPVAVISKQPACPGEPVAVQCTLGGRILTWNTPDGAFSLVRGRQEKGDSGSFHWTLQEFDAGILCNPHLPFLQLQRLL